MLRIVATTALFITSEAARCRTKKCDDPFTFNKDACKCECPNTCESYQTQNADSCACEDKPCTPCAPGEGGAATLGDFQQGAQPDCECLPAEGNSACDAIYGGKWDKDLEGNAWLRRRDNQ